jgi:outer membrane protein
MKKHRYKVEISIFENAANAAFGRYSVPGVFLVSTLLIGVSPACAEDLTQAINAAYERSAVIANAVAEYEADIEGVTISRAEGLPSVNASLGLNETLAGTRNGSGLVTVQGQVSVPLYRGGSVRNRVNAARSQSDASFVAVRSAEAEVFAEVVTAYATVIRDRHILALSRNNLETLTTTLNATRARFRARDLTRTDVSQAESRVALAQGEVETAEASLVEAMEEFQRLTAIDAINLQPLPPFQDLPVNAEMAAVVALEENPQLLAARAIAEARRYETRAARGGALPSVSASVNGRYGSGEDLVPTQQDQSRFGASVGLSVNVPLFQGGGTAAGIRQANIRESQALLSVRDLERTVVARARSEYANWRATSSVALASERAVEAARSALAGVRAESDVGTRTILDILNAEQELRNAQVQLVSAQRDSYVAAFSLLTTMGRTQAHHLGLRRDTAQPLNSEYSVPAAFGSSGIPADIELEPSIPSPVAPQPLIVAEVLPIGPSITLPPADQLPAPVRRAEAVAEAAQPAPAPQPVRQADPFEPTEWVIQLAAHSDESTARSYWNAIEAVTARTVGRTRPVIAAFRSGNRELFRLAIGPFADFAAAETACHDLRLQNQNCIVRRFSTLGNLRWTGMDTENQGSR